MDLHESVRRLPVLLVPKVPGLVLRPIPARKGYVVGSRGQSHDEEPRFEVDLEPIGGSADMTAFWMADAPVTQAQFALWTNSDDYDAFRAAERQAERQAGRAGKRHRNEFENRPDHPADSVTWFEARAYCRWLRGSALEVLESKNRPSPWFPEPNLQFSLPSEIAWEIACRAFTNTEFHSGDGAAALRQAGWFEDENDQRGTHPIRMRQANAFGLFDMHGNVWEWCVDVYDPGAYRNRMDGLQEDLCCTDSDGDDGQAFRVVRGGSWYYPARFCRSASRNGGGPDNRDGNQGFRVCLLRGP